MNGAGYTAVDVVLDKAHPGHRIGADTVFHFDRPASIPLASETRDLRFVGMPLDTILLTSASTLPEEASMATGGHHLQESAACGRVRLHIL